MFRCIYTPSRPINPKTVYIFETRVQFSVKLLSAYIMLKYYTECPVKLDTLSKHYFSAPNKDIKIPKDIVCRGSFAILSNVLQAK